MQAWLATWRERVYRWHPEAIDGSIYFAAAVFAALTYVISAHGDYRQWAEIALGFYLGAALISVVHSRRARPSPGRLRGMRLAVFATVALGAAVAPLATAVILQAKQGGTVHAQPEVTVVEAAAHRLYVGKDPYLGPPPGHRALTAPAGTPAYEEYFPYLPGMVAFGVAHSTSAPQALTDPRVLFITAVLFMALLALLFSAARGESRIRALQLLTVLPTAALPLATGGDDLPVIGLMVLGLVFLQRRWPVAAGLVLGAGASLKFTAWPLLVLAVFAAWDKSGHWAIGRYAAAAAAVIVPTVVPFAIENPLAFVDNVVRFPLGLAGVGSPARSPLPGHWFVTAFPSLRGMFTVVVLVAGTVILGQYLLRHTPRRASEVAAICGWMMALGIALAPATRFGYFIYPVTLLTWSLVLRSEPSSVNFGDAARLRSARVASQSGVVIS